MYIIIIGGGSVGHYLCRALLSEGHEVLVLDKDAAKCERFGDELGYCAYNDFNLVDVVMRFPCHIHPSNGCSGRKDKLESCPRFH